MFLVKCIVIGDSGIGKSSISDYFVNRKFAGYEHISTIGIEFYPTIVAYNEKQIKMHIWDTAGQERFQAIARSYYRDAHGALICFSITNRKTFENIPKKFDDLKLNSNPNIRKVLVGTFSDKPGEREVSPDEIMELAEKYDVDYYEVSARTGKNVDDAFMGLVEQLSNCIDINIFDCAIRTPNYSYKLDSSKNSIGKCCNI
jgi:small GTP-binding protein